MGQGVGELNVGVTARTGNARKNVNDFRKDVRGVRADAMHAAAGVKLMAAGIGALVIARRVGGVIGDAAKDIDSLAKSSRVIGVTTEDLAGLRLAASETGVATNTLEKGIKNLLKNVAEASQGFGEARDSILALGLDPEELALKSAIDQFREVAAAMESVENHTTRVGIAYDLFGGRGVDLLNTLNLGRQGLDETAEAARRLGIAVDAESAAKIEHANDSIGRMKAAGSGLANELAILLTPAFELTAEAGVTASIAIRTLGGLLDDNAGSSDLAAQAARDKAAADDRAAAAAGRRRENEAKVTAEFEKQIAVLKRKRLDATLGEGTSQLRDETKQFGAARASQLQDERERVEDIKEEVAQSERLLAIKQRIADVGKSALQIEREAELRNSFTKAKKEEVNALYDELERVTKKKEREEESARKAERHRAEMEREAKRLQNDEERKQKQIRRTEFRDRLRNAGRENAEILDARTSSGFAALRSSVNKTDRQALMLQVAKEQKLEQKRAADALDLLVGFGGQEPAIFTLQG